MEPLAQVTGSAVHVDCVFVDGAERTLAEDVLDGLTKPFKELPPKHFYDARGSELFDRICELPEYYPTRTERAILTTHAAEMIDLTQAGELVELGSGSADKTRVLLDAMAEAGLLRRYVPIDVSEIALRESAARLIDEYPGMQVHGLVGDFERHLDRLPEPLGNRLMCFLGGTLGNFTPGIRRRFLRGLGRHLGPGGHLLLGVDLVKDPRVIEAAYNDSAGVTADFNRNVLGVVNRELRADFDLDAFEHVAFYDTEHEWVEMRLRARSAQTVRVQALDLTVNFAAREELRTEISAKFTPERLEGDLRAAGLEPAGWFTDADLRFAVALARVPA
ncbi:MAG: L-histidine Nalpha-methyltransferase [Solirubrobacteraceae bacterium]|nr:L-histidine Nalpha-methyltransferase [Solirubrobacteraceae bacterium]